MGLREMRAVVAKLLTDDAYQKRFFADATRDPAPYRLTPDEFAHLRKLDPKRLGISSEGYAGKRFERLEGVFPRALAALTRSDREARLQYLARTAFPTNDEREYHTFRAYVDTGWPWPDHVRRLLLDLRDVEWALYSTPHPAPAAYRYRPEALRPERHAIPLLLRGPADRALVGTPDEYPDEPGRWLIAARAPTLTLQPLRGDAARAWDACDGRRTLAEVVTEQGPAAERLLRAWLDAGLVRDAANE